MKIIVGLGNPGAKYRETHHNIGFLAVDYLVRAWNARGPIEKHNAFIWQTRLGDHDVMLIQPQTFMNLSGQSVGPLMRFYKCSAEDLIVIHDELDLDPGVLRLKVGGGNGGHNGLRSIDEHVGAELRDYVRVRLGIGHPRRLNLPMDVADFVLMKFRADDAAVLDEIFRDVDSSVRLVMDGKIREAMNLYHRTPRDPDKEAKAGAKKARPDRAGDAPKGESAGSVSPGGNIAEGSSRGADNGATSKTLNQKTEKEKK